MHNFEATLVQFTDWKKLETCIVARTGFSISAKGPQK